MSKRLKIMTDVNNTTRTLGWTMAFVKETMPEIDVDKINMDSRLKEDLGLDSIGLMMLSLSLEEEFNFQFEDAVMFLTVQDVVSFLEKHGK